MDRQKLIVAAVAAVFSLTANAQTSSTPANPYQAEIDANAQRKAALEAETATLNAEKARADARKAAIESDVAAAKARIGVVEGTEDYKGGVTVKEKGGAMEANLLASRAISELAAKVARKVEGKTSPNQRILIFGGAAGPTYNNFVQFYAQVVIVDKTLFDATEAAAKAEADADQALKAAQERRDKAKPKVKPKPVAPDVVIRAQAAPALATAGAVLGSLNNLFSFLRTKYEVGGADTKIDETALVHSVAEWLAAGRNVVVPDAYLPTIVAQAEKSGVVNELIALAKKKAEAVESAARLGRKAEQITAFVKDESDAAQKAALEKHAAALTRHATELTKAATVFDTFLTKLTAADEKGAAAFAVILREQELHRLLTEKGAQPAVLLVKLQAQGGSYYTRENMWTFLGRMPFFNSGGAVASYVLLDGTSGKLTSSGLEYWHTGWMRADEIDRRVNRESPDNQPAHWMGNRRSPRYGPALSD